MPRDGLSPHGSACAEKAYRRVGWGNGKWQLHPNKYGRFFCCQMSNRNLVARGMGRKGAQSSLQWWCQIWNGDTEPGSGREAERAGMGEAHGFPVWHVVSCITRQRTLEGRGGLSRWFGSIFERRPWGRKTTCGGRPARSLRHGCMPRGPSGTWVDTVGAPQR